MLSFGFEFSVGIGGFCHRTGSDLHVFPFTKCQIDTVKKHTHLQYILALTLVT